MSRSLLIEDISFLILSDKNQTVVTDAWVFIEDGFIKSFGEGSPPKINVSKLSGRNKIVTPGLVNTHHHFYQNMARAYTPGNNLPLLPWLERMNKLWKAFREDDLKLCTQLGIAELMLSGATTIADHHYVFTEGSKDMTLHQFLAAEEMGVRFHASRGSMNLKSHLVSDWALQTEDEILEDTLDLIENHHDGAVGSFRQIIVAPCAATSCSRSLLEASAAMAKEHDVGLHTHCGETKAENDFSVEKFGMRPLEYLLECGWDYGKAWLAHGIHFNDEELKLLSEYRIGVAHCPNANMRLGSGICRVPELIEQEVKVGIGVDGSASNDSGHILGELRQALYLARVKYGADALSALDALELGTWRAAQLMGRNDVGEIAVGKCGDLALFPVDDLYANAAENPVDALLICHPRQVSDLVVAGSIRIKDGVFTDIDLDSLMARHKTRANEIRTLAFA